MTHKLTIIYDSVSGNTAKTAQALAQMIPNTTLVMCKDWKDTSQTECECVLLLSPTRGGGNISRDMKQCVLSPIFWDNLPDTVCIITAGDSIGYKKTFCHSHKQIEILAEYHGKKVISSHMIDTPQTQYYESCAQWIQQAMHHHWKQTEQTNIL